jgi:hypothetical protein
MKKAIEKLKKQLKAEVIELATAINEDRKQINGLSNKLGNLKTDCKIDYRNLYDALTHLQVQTKTIHTNTQKPNSNATTSPETAKNTIVTNAMFNEQTSQILLDIRNSQLQLIAYQALDTILATGLHYTHIQALITSTLIKKGNEYSQETDRYSNFIEEDITIPQAIKNYQQKHIRWLLDYQDGKIQANILLILEHCIDIINYSILLKVWEKFNAI